MAAPFDSSFSLSKLVEITGEATDVIESLTSQLQEAGVDPAPAERGQDDDSGDAVERVARLVALARGNGFCVVLNDRERGGQGGLNRLRVVKPAEIRMLQSGHHRQLAE